MQTLYHIVVVVVVGKLYHIVVVVCKIFIILLLLSANSISYCCCCCWQTLYHIVVVVVVFKIHIILLFLLANPISYCCWTPFTHDVQFVSIQNYSLLTEDAFLGLVAFWIIISATKWKCAIIEFLLSCDYVLYQVFQ